MLANVAGPSKYANKRNNHFDPFAALFKPKEAVDIFVSSFGVLLVLAGLGYAAWTVGPLPVLAYFGVPYLVVNLHLVLITYLQHTAVYVPHYREPEFTWLRGALSTVDRTYGFGLDTVFHRITDTHVVHHLFSNMPFYHAAEATAAVKGLLGPYYLYDPTPVPTALWHSWTNCKFVATEGSYLHFLGPQDHKKTA